MDQELTPEELEKRILLAPQIVIKPSLSPASAEQLIMRALDGATVADTYWIFFGDLSTAAAVSYSREKGFEVPGGFDLVVWDFHGSSANKGNVQLKIWNNTQPIAETFGDNTQAIAGGPLLIPGGGVVTFGIYNGGGGSQAVYGSLYAGLFRRKNHA